MQYPIEKLHYSVTELLSQMEIVKKAVAMGLKSKIIFAEYVDGHKVYAEIHPSGQVYLSPSFCQFLWNMSYSALIITDTNILLRELKVLGFGQSLFVQMITSYKGYPAVDFLLSEFNAKPWEHVFELGVKCLYGNLTSVEEKEIENQDMTSVLTEKVNSIYRSALFYALLHEAEHWVNNHFYRTMPRIEKEKEADGYAFDEILKSSDNVVRRTHAVGCMSILCAFFFLNPHFKNNGNYPYEDERLFAQFDKLSGRDMESCRCLIVNVLSAWAKYNAIKEFPALSGDDEADLHSIRQFLHLYSR